ncbi:MAG: hypothetical protein CO129_05375 [Ignavibacteriales bacterium CG_4_9_14_3_um_filter_34_10]|nr:MAG: hypothetical protein CO129_05375 [Ignavibacteriales bacterium CG_4_9_14_3_um_filter_34_10]
MILSNTDIKKINLDQLIDDYLIAGKIDKLLIVVPTNRRVRQLKKMLIDSTQRKTVSYINIETLWTLADKVLHKKMAYIDLDDAVAKVLLSQCFKKSDLKFFNKFKHQLPFGTLEKIKNYFSKLKENGIYPNEFFSLIEKVDETEKLKARDLQNLYSTYFQKTISQNIYEIGDVFYFLSNLDVTDINQYFQSVFPLVEKIIFLGFDELRKPEINFISKISSNKNVEVFLKFDYYKFNPKAFGHIIKTFIGLKKQKFNEVTDKSFFVNNELFTHFRQEIFKSKNVNRKFNSPNVFRIKANNRQTEIELIAKQIKSLILERNVNPADICVVFNLIENYSDIIRDVFEQYEIPLNLTDRFLLKQSPSVISLINLLEIIEDDYHYKAITKAFSNSFISNSIDINNLLKFSREFKITSNFNRWVSAVEMAKYNADEGDYNFDLAKVLYDLKSIKNLLEPFEKKHTIREFLKIFDELFVKTKMLQKILSLNQNAAERNIRSLESFFVNIKLMLELDEKELPDQKYDIGFFLDTLKGIASHTRFNIKEKTMECVLVTTVNEIRGLNFDYLFVGGLCNRDFPTKYNPELIMSKQIASGEISHLQKEKFYFYQAITSWRKNLYLSFPMKDNDSELVESNFLVELSEIIEINELLPESFDKIIFTKKDEYQILGSIDAKSLKMLDVTLNLSDENLNMISKKLEIEEIKRENSENPFSGGLDAGSQTDNGLNSLLKTISQKEFSVTEMETFSKCPFQYFAKNILRIAAEKDPTEMIESFELGNYLHKIFFLFYSEMRDRDIDIGSCDVQNYNLAKEILFKIAVDVIPPEIKKSQFSFYEIEKIFGLNGKESDSILIHFLEHERRENLEFKPRFFEVGFGNVKYNSTDDRLSSTEAARIDDINMKGKIDRIDLRNADNENQIRIVDYKLSGKKPAKNDFHDGIALQLPIYAFVAKSLLFQKLNVNYDVEGLKIFSLKYSEKDFRLVDFAGERKSDARIDELINLALEKIKSNVNQIKEGKFFLTKLENYGERICKFCDFKTICRINEII